MSSFGTKIAQGSYGNIHAGGKDKVVKVQVINDYAGDPPEELLKNCVRETEIQTLCAKHDIAPRIHWVKQYEAKVKLARAKLNMTELHRARAQQLLSELSQLCDDVKAAESAHEFTRDVADYVPDSADLRDGPARTQGLKALQDAKNKLQSACKAVARASPETAYPSTLYVIAMQRCQITLMDFMKKHIGVGNSVRVGSKKTTLTVERIGDSKRHQHDVLLSDGKWYNSRECSNAQPYLPLEEARNIIAVMEQMDELGIQHGDFKTNNCMREFATGDSKWMLIDFGYSQYIDPRVLENMRAHGAKLNVIIALATLVPESYSTRAKTSKHSVLPVPSDIIKGATYLTQKGVAGPDDTLAYLRSELSRQIQCWRNMNENGFFMKQWRALFSRNAHLQQCLVTTKAPLLAF